MLLIITLRANRTCNPPFCNEKSVTMIIIIIEFECKRKLYAGFNLPPKVRNGRRPNFLALLPGETPRPPKYPGLASHHGAKLAAIANSPIARSPLSTLLPRIKIQFIS